MEDFILNVRGNLKPKSVLLVKKPKEKRENSRFQNVSSVKPIDKFGEMYHKIAKPSSKLNEKSKKDRKVTIKGNHLSRSQPKIRQSTCSKAETTSNIPNSKFTNSGSSLRVPDLMNVHVAPLIEPVFSEKDWKELCTKLGIHSHIIGCLLDKFKLSRLTAIQEASFSPLIQGRNALIRAQTGSGKTLAYAVPLLNGLMGFEPPITRISGSMALIVLPTRELATQTLEVFQLLCKSCVRIVPGLLIGGMKRKAQKASLRKGVNIVIGTPQRILDHILRTESLNLSNLRWLVIDEADRLLEMGFERDVRRIIEHIQQVATSESNSANGLQTVLLSATLTPGVEKLAGMTLKDPIRCVVGEAENSYVGNDVLSTSEDPVSQQNADQFIMPAGLRHFILVVPWKLRLVALAAFLLLKCQYHKKGGKLIVFMATQDCVDFHYQLFKAVLCPDDEEYIIPAHASHLSLFRLHGSMEHSQRESVFHSFSVSKCGILLTTDVASRGLDLASVGWVVQYHVTGGPVDYVHRVGRTARAGGRGKAVLFLNADELGYVDLLRARAGMHFEQLNLTDLLQTSLYHIRNTRRRGDRQAPSCATVEESISRFSHLFLDAVNEDPVLNPLAETAYISFLRAYASFSGELRQFFTFKRLHLGHVARAFALQATPKAIASRVTGRIRGKETGGKSIANRKRKADYTEKEVEVPRLSKRRSEVMDFDKPHATERSKSVKPVDIARRNMLAEYGL